MPEFRRGARPQAGGGGPRLAAEHLVGAAAPSAPKRPGQAASADSLDTAQAALAAEARKLRASLARLADLYDALLPPADYDDRLEGEKPWDRATEILTMIEGVTGEGLPALIQLLERAAATTDADLLRQYRSQRRKQRRIADQQRPAGRQS